LMCHSDEHDVNNKTIAMALAVRLKSSHRTFGNLSMYAVNLATFSGFGL